MNTSAKLYSLSFANVKTYLFALLFVAGNIILPQLCHLIPMGGPTLLPIYFFTLIAAYKFGIRVGLLTALLSPIVNHLLFGMPAAAVLPAILIKSGLLAIAASAIARYAKDKVTLGGLLIAVLSYQIIGTAFEWMLCGNFYLAVQDFRMGVPGMLLQWLGGYFALKAIANR
ncbi:ECF transporter S component [uncultured Mediterranea sp.]|uniref:ECF transporter S component n=1 Tax=uncultured Mediterranea sp. TaxID=1926662 RepID=UPI0027D96D4D|nr:ECF transporter S component [uncultured Mediterranea sp.]